jgi:hypothetical protein
MAQSHEAVTGRWTSITDPHQEDDMRRAVSCLRPGIRCGLLLLAMVRPSFAQSDTTNIPLPPAAELAALQPFFGAYEHDDNYWEGMGPFRGTLEVRPAVKGWYVEWIINTQYGPIDRQLRMLITWDRELGHYRVWRFETLPQLPPGAVEAEARFEGEEFVMEWRNTPGPAGGRGTFRNRIRMESPDELVVVSEVEPEAGGLIRLGVWRNRRVADAQTK